MNFRIDSRIVSFQDSSERPPASRLGAEPADVPDAGGSAAETASAAVLNQNRAAAASSPLGDSAAAIRAASLIRNQIATRPSVALAAHQLTPATVSSLLS